MSIIIVLGLIALVAVLAAIRAVTNDGYRRQPVCARSNDESIWSWR